MLVSIYSPERQSCIVCDAKDLDACLLEYKLKKEDCDIQYAKKSFEIKSELSCRGY